jgi:uncharacterized protein YfaS (alpha-2-macroglobulin family)
VLDKDASLRQPVSLPLSRSSDLGGLSVDFASSYETSSSGARDYLLRYPHECAEQTASGLLAVGAALRGEAFTPTGSKPKSSNGSAEFTPESAEALQAEYERRMTRLQFLQHESGGFVYWPGADKVEPFVSGYVAWVLHWLKLDGHAVPGSLLEGAHRYLRAQLKQANAETPTEADLRTAVFALFVLPRDEAYVPWASALFQRRAQLPLFHQVLLFGAIAQQGDEPLKNAALSRLRDEIAAHVSLQGDGARLSSSSVGYAWFDSELRTQALWVLTLLQALPQDPLLAPLVQGLLDAQREGHWSNTQENAYVLLALRRYNSLMSGGETALRVRAWLAASNAGSPAAEANLETQLSFAPVQLTPKQTHVHQTLAWQQVPTQAPLSWMLQREGTGRLHYRLGMQWQEAAPTASEDAGLQLSRRLRDIHRQETATAELGGLYALEVSVRSPVAQHHVAVELPLPAGLEAMANPLDRDQARRLLGAGYPHWLSHTETYPDRVRIYLDALTPGETVWSIPVRATTAGNFSWPAARAELMYYPHVFGRSAPAKLQVTSTAR